MNVVKFHNRAVIPPRGGWTFPVQGRMILAHSEQGLIEELLKIAKANNTPTSKEMVELELWRYFCAREPERCKKGESLGPEQSNADILTPEVFGPIIWRFLNLAAARFQKAFFFSLLDHIPILMTCEECRKHWREIVEAHPPGSIVSAKAASIWVNDRHNEVNARTGKQPYSYERMVAEYGAPP